MHMSDEEKIKKVIDDIKPYLNADGGDIEFVKYENDTVFVRLYGACSHCGYQDYTLNEGILELIKETVPNVNNIVNVDI